MKIETPQQLDAAIQSLTGMVLPIELITRKWTEKRTSPQNRYLFGACYKPIAEAMGYDVDDIHEYCCGRFFGWKDERTPKTPNNPNGLRSVPFRTTTRDENGRADVMDKKQFSEFVDMVHRVASQCGAVILERWEE